MTSPRPQRSRGALVAAALLALVAFGCDKFSARVEFKKAISQYKNEEYRQAIVTFQKGLALDPEAKAVWRSVGLSAMALYRPGDPNPENLQYARLAVEAFNKYLAAYPKDEKVQDYLLTILLSSERYDEALKKLQEAKTANPEDMKLEEGIVNVLVKAKRLDEAAKHLSDLGPRATFGIEYGVGVALWDDVFHNPTPDMTRRTQEVETGLAALRKAVEMKPESFEANTYINLMIREKAKLESDPQKQQDLYAEAEKFRAKAIELAKKNKG